MGGLAADAGHHAQVQRTRAVRRHRRGGRGSRPNVRTDVLALLLERPMHGYQLMQAIAEQDDRILTSVKGVGKKTAEKLLIDAKSGYAAAATSKNNAIPLNFAEISALHAVYRARKGPFSTHRVIRFGGKSVDRDPKLQAVKTFLFRLP